VIVYPPLKGAVQEIVTSVFEITEVVGAVGVQDCPNQFMVKGLSRIRFGETELSVALKM
jgi:hypothetical protein